MTLMQTLAADISAELAATEPRRSIESDFIKRRAPQTQTPVAYTINAQGIILNAHLTTESQADAVAISDFIIRHNAQAREKSVLSR